MKKYIADDRRLEHLIHRIYHHSGISKRHTVVKDFIPGKNQTSFYFDNNSTAHSPSTGQRNRRFIEHATPLLQKTGSDLLEQNPSVEPADITHVITVSCTGFFAPGPDLAVVQDLGLSHDTRRYNLGFMGCYAALPALQLAQTICEADPDSWKFTSLVWASLDAGLRPVEVGDARVGWCEPENGLLRIPREDSAKNEGNWTVGITDRTATTLERWIDERAHHPRYEDTDKLWLTRHGNRYGSNELSRILKDLCDRAEISYENRQMS
jgi:hypothetical protein